MTFGMGVMRLPPAAFWGMTLRELAAVIAGVTREAKESIGRRELQALLALYPDDPKPSASRVRPITS